MVKKNTTHDIKHESRVKRPFEYKVWVVHVVHHYIFFRLCKSFGRKLKVWGYQIDYMTLAAKYDDELWTVFGRMPACR